MRTCGYEASCHHHQDGDGDVVVNDDDDDDVVVNDVDDDKDVVDDDTLKAGQSVTRSSMSPAQTIPQPAIR